MVMRVLILGGALALLTAHYLSTHDAKVKVDAAGPHAPVVVELFTSEGCSSCPPADRLLIELQKQSRADAEIIVLSEHVDYWDQLGWKDPFSARQFSDRQSEYARLQMSDEVYTPQMVVDGHLGFTGSDVHRAAKEILNSAKDQKVGVKIEELDSAAGSTRLRISAEDTKSSELLLAVTEDGLQTQVKRGENGGHILAHTGVVRWMKAVGKFDKKASAMETTVAIDPAWKRENLRIVAILQRPSGLVIGAASQRLR